MRIAVAVTDKKVALDFQQSNEFYIYEVYDRDATSRRIEQSPTKDNSMLVTFLKNQRIDVIISGCMSKEAQESLKLQRIKQLTGAIGEPDAVVEDYLSWSTKLDENACIS